MQKLHLLALVASLFIVQIFGEVPPNGSLAYINDNNVLQYALTLEHLEAAFYNQGLTNLTETQFNNAGINGSIYMYLGMVRAHENTHVAALQVALSARGATPVQACQYNFSVSTVAQFIAIASALENTGVYAYNGAVASLTDVSLLTYAATIATVEARHAAFLNVLNNNASPFPNATDLALTPQAIFAIASQFILSCPQNLTFPVPADTFRNLNGSSVNQTAYNPYVNTSAPFKNDNVALNYALTLELLEATFYNQGLANFTTAASLNVTTFQYAQLQLVRDHENAHVALLQVVLNARGATPVLACNYTFTYTDSTSFLKLAATLENTGVSAYDGAHATITSELVLTYAATIASVEARHAAFLNELTGVSPFPNATDTALTPQQIATAITPLLNGCPQAVVLPVPSDTFRQTNSTGSVTSGVTSGVPTTGISTTGMMSTTVAFTTGISTTGATTATTTDAESSSSTSIVASILFIVASLFVIA